MLPIVYELQFFGISRPIGGYGLMVSLGVLITGILSARAAHHAKEDWGAVIATIGYATIPAFLGAAALFFVVELVRAGFDVDAVLSRGPGLVFYGAVPGALLGTFYAARWLKVPWWKMVDLSVPAIAAGHALGRVGCLLGGCCFGAEWHGPWSITATAPMAPMAQPSVPRHPVQLYEALGLIALALVFAATPLHAKWLGAPGSGRRIASYAVLYGVLRSLVEVFRGDGVRGVFLGGLVSTSQLVSLVVIGVGVAGVLRARRLEEAARAPTSAVPSAAGPTAASDP
ncbi:MAG: prolipoprotein diacylglyceryl transferase [Deltaproteobacteria bacterium]|jgi:phosphatidylglycerol:prolipoprotein diacylglycerol transferase